MGYSGSRFRSGLSPRPPWVHPGEVRLPDIQLEVSYRWYLVMVRHGTLLVNHARRVNGEAQPGAIEKIALIFGAIFLMSFIVRELYIWGVLSLHPYTGMNYPLRGKSHPVTLVR